MAFHNRAPQRVQNRVRINHQIRLSPVRLIGADGGQVGIVTIEEAREIARKDGLDLVEVDPNSRPIVCKILDWGRAKYDLAKKEKAAKRHEKTLEIKQVKFRPGIDDHDFLTKLAHARRFLEDGKRTKVTIMFRRRDLRRPENGIKVLDRVAQELSKVGKVESRPGKIENRDLTMVLVPLAGVGHALKPPRPEKKTAPPAAKPEAVEPQGEEPTAAAPETGESQGEEPAATEPEPAAEPKTTGKAAAAAPPEAVSSR